MNRTSSFFLGTSAPGGFLSLYNELDGLYLYCIKGTPGSGKSTFMRSIANQAETLGWKTERILCSGDPDSLDGVIIPEKQLAYVDATAPHVQEPTIPGVTGEYLPLGELARPISASDRSALRAKKIASGNCYRRVYELLTALSALTHQLESAADRKTALQYEMIPPGDGFREHRRFLRAITADGFRFLPGALDGLERILLPDRESMERARELCRERQQECILCPFPLRRNTAEAILVPACGIVFLNQAVVSENGSELILSVCHPSDKELCRQLQNAIMAELTEARRIHREIESIYRPYIGFEENDRLMNQHIRLLRERA